jgi:choline monooxygenase
MDVHGFDPAPPTERAATPPAAWYVDPAFHELERARVFGAAWQLAARLDQLERPGDFVAGGAAGRTWVTLRDGEGRLRAFHNVCRHHAAELCRGSGRVERLVCPYHGWTYGLDGRLESAPGLGAAPGFDRADFALPELAVATLDRLVFVNPAREAAPLEPRAAELARRLAAFPAELVFVERRTYELDCNWKVFVDNYLDGGYHVAHLHGGLAGELELEGYRTEVCEGLGEQLSIQSSPGAGGERTEGGAVYAFLHPNCMLNRYGPWLDTNLVLPLGPARTRVVMDYWVEPGRAGDEAFVRASLAASLRVHEEDVAISESVQRGLASGAYERGRYAARERAMHAFHRCLARDLGDSSRT